MPDVQPGRLASGSFTLVHRRGRRVGYSIAYPAAKTEPLKPVPADGFETGGHDQAYWRRTAPTQLSFLAGWLEKVR